jgi:hypothetical protein
MVVISMISSDLFQVLAAPDIGERKDEKCDGAKDHQKIKHERRLLLLETSCGSTGCKPG